MTGLLTAREVAQLVGVNPRDGAALGPGREAAGGPAPVAASGSGRTLNAWLVERATPGRGASTTPADAARRLP